VLQPVAPRSGTAMGTQSTQKTYRAETVLRRRVEYRRKLISTLSVEPIAKAMPRYPSAQIKTVIRTRVPKLQPPPPRLPADQALAPDLLKLYREAASKASLIPLFGRAFQHVLSPVITVTYEPFAV